MVESDAESKWHEKIVYAITRLDNELARDSQILETTKGELEAHERKQESFFNRLFPARWRKKKNMFDRWISHWQSSVDNKHNLKQSLANYAPRIEAARARYQSKKLATQQRRMAITESRKQLFREAIESLQPDRSELSIRKIDYKRGNQVENFIRANWMTNILEAYKSECFICKSKADLTLDHLWMPKNEGGNFVMCKADGGLLISNVLLLCRSCNSSKGEKQVDQFFSYDQLNRLLTTQQGLSKSMMADDSLCRIAQRWYRTSIKTMTQYGTTSISDSYTSQGTLL
jgi:5-methylcytosine-specific restriction endonuclease McrA